MLRRQTDQRKRGRAKMEGAKGKTPFFLTGK
jgi:hypothetical protein